MNQLANCLGASSLLLSYAFIFANCACVSNEHSKCVFELPALEGMLQTCPSPPCVRPLTFNLHSALARHAYLWLRPLSRLPGPPSPQPHAPYFHSSFPGSQHPSRAAWDFHGPIPVVLK